MLSTITNKLLEQPVEYAILFILLTVLLTIAIEQVAGLVKTHKEYKLALIELANKFKTIDTVTELDLPTVTQTYTPIVSMYDYFQTQLLTSSWSDSMKLDLISCVYKPSVSRQIHFYDDTFVSYVVNGRGDVKLINIDSRSCVYATSDEETMKKGFFIKLGKFSYFLLDTK